MDLLVESPFQSLENTVVWLLIVFSVCALSLTLVERASAARLSASDAQ